MEQYINGISIQHRFDAYCKKVLKNEAKNIRKRNSRISKNEESFNHSNESKYPHTEFEDYSIYLLFGLEILVSDQKLSYAIDNLSEIKRQVVLLYYFVGFNDGEIAQILDRSIGGIWYQRTKAIEQLKMGYGL